MGDVSRAGRADSRVAKADLCASQAKGGHDNCHAESNLRLL